MILLVLERQREAAIQVRQTIVARTDFITLCSSLFQGGAEGHSCPCSNSLRRWTPCQAL